MSNPDKLIRELLLRFNDPAVQYAGLMCPAGDGNTLLAVLAAIPNCSVVAVDQTLVEFWHFGLPSNPGKADRELLLRGYESRVLQLYLDVEVAAQRLAGRKFDFLVWDDEDWSYSEHGMRMVRFGGLAALWSGAEWVLR